MLVKLKTTLKGRVRAVRSNWRPCPVQVDQFQRHGNSASDFADWLERISAHGIGYLPGWSQVEARREQLLAQHGTGIDDDLSVHFFGPGAELENIHVNARGGQFLASVVRRFEQPTVIEFGTAFGVSGMYMLTTIGGGRLITFDPCQDWRDVAIDNLRAIGGDFERIPDTFEHAFPPLAVSLAPIHVAFVDGLHTYENVMREVSLLEPHMPEGSVMILHDVELDQEMRQAWSEVKQKSRIRCSAFVERQFGVIELGPRQVDPSVE